MTRLLLITALLAAAAPSALAQADGKLSLTKLFRDVATSACASTVRVRCDGKDAALGTVIDANGYILTKGSELRGSISVRLRDGSEYDAEYVAYHEKSDLALLKIDATDLVPVKLSEAKFAEAGNMVAATGMDSEPVAAGIISAGVRKLFGEEQRIVNGNKGWLGIRLADRQGGVFVGKFDTQMLGKSPAKEAGIRENDQIVSIASTTVEKFEDLATALGKYKPGDKVKVHIRRKAKDKDGFEDITFDVKLGNGALFDRSEMQNRMGSALSGRRTGFPQVITTDLVIRPVDCGGPVVDLEGHVLGIVIARAGRVETWILPQDVVKDVTAELKSGKLKPKKD